MALEEVFESAVVALEAVGKEFVADSIDLWFM